MSLTRRGRIVKPIKRYRPEGPVSDNEEEPEKEEKKRPEKKTTPAPPVVDHESLVNIYRELLTQTTLMKRTLRSLSETREVALDIHEELAELGSFVKETSRSTTATTINDNNTNVTAAAVEKEEGEVPAVEAPTAVAVGEEK
jgi:hypothetical protein